ncbi:SBP domain-containing protein, partial [Haematococcus lacustris]
VCHVDNCYADLSGLRDYHQRFKICDYHLKCIAVLREGQPQRFCQQCGRFHPVSEFDGVKRSCRTR